MMKRFFLTLCTLCASAVLWAAEVVVDGITLTYEVAADDTVTITICSALAEGVLKIPEEIEEKPVTAIGDGAITAPGLTAVTLPSTVITIGKYAFYGCEGLTSFVIPDSVTSIGDGAFYNCESLTSILFEGEPIESVGSDAFPYNAKGYYYACYEDAWSSYWGSWNNLIMEEFVDPNTALFSYSVANNEAMITGLRGECPAELVIPAKIDGWPVTTIKYEAFDGCTNLTSVVISEGITTIGRDAFYNCSGLTSVTIPSSVTSIGRYVFGRCESLALVMLPSNVTSIGYGAFFYCSGLTSITLPEGLKTIDASAFKSTGLTSVTIPSSVTEIGDGAFDAAPLKSVIFEGVPPEIGDDVFNCSHGYYFSETAASWEAVCTNGMWNNLTMYEITDGDEATADIFFTYTVTDGKATITGLQNYYYEKIVIPAEIAGMPVVAIGSEAFSGCLWLTSITIPAGITEIDSSAFSGVAPTTLTATWVPGGMSRDKLTTVIIPEGTTEIPDSAFSDCPVLASVTIPDSVTSIGEKVFDKCPNLYKDANGVQYESEAKVVLIKAPSVVTGEFIIPSSVRFVQNYPFLDSDCTELTLIEIPASTSLSWQALSFYCAPKLKIVVDAQNPFYASQDGALFTKDMKTIIRGPGGTETYAIPDSVTEFAEYSFSGCSQLTTVTIPDSVVEGGYCVFSFCSSLTSVTIPESITEIETSMFRGCTSLVSVNLPSTLTYIGMNAFEGCTSLTSIVIPGTTAIGGQAFYNCTGLTSVTISEGVPYIWWFAFFNCSSLTSITIPSSVTEIGVGAFEGNTSLTSVTFLGTPPVTDDSSFPATTGYYLGQYATEWEAEIVDGKWENLTMQVIRSTITFDANGGEGGEVVTLPSGTVLTPPTVSREGYVFVGWSPEVPETVPDTDMTYTAQWQLGQYTQTFDANGGEGGTSVTQEYGSALTPPVVTREGHTFLGWSPAVPSTVPAANATYVAQWQVHMYTIVFDENGGKGGYGIMLNYGFNLTPPQVTREGYTFVGWEPEVPATVPAENTTYTAQWKINQYTQTFDANGGVGGTSLTLDYGSSLTAPTVSREEHTFLGWSPAVPSTVPASHTIYTAQWKVNQYTITFDANGAEGGTEATLDYGSTLTAPTLVREGYTFTGWSPAVPSTVPAANTTYTAQWQINQYTITFDANGGEGGTTVTQDYGLTLTAPAVTREGYTFTGWSPEVPSTVPAADVTYTAQWKVNQYTIAFDANGAEGGTEATLDYGSTLTAPTLVREGYTFVGWLPEVPSTVPAANTTYTAQWQINQYTVTFDANGGEGGVSVKQDYGSVITAPDVTREGHVFLGWTPSVPATVPAADATYTAQWQDVSFLTYTIEGGVATITGLQAVYPATLEIPATIGDVPVVAIAERAFAGCTALTSVSIPATVTTIGTGAFTACGSPVITVAEANSAYASADGVLFNKEMTTLISAPCVTGSYTLPEIVTAVGPSAFENCAGTLVFPGVPLKTVGEGAFPEIQATYYYESVTAWKAVIADGKWHNLTMSCANPPSFDVTLTAVGGGSVSGGGVYKWEESVTVSAIADEGWVFCGWSSTPAALTADYTFEMPEHAVTLAAYFAPKLAVDLTIDRYLAENELISKDEIKEMAFETPIVEVGADEIEISISLQTAETLNAWNPMILQGATLEIDEANGMVRVRVPKGDKKAAFYKFVVPTEQSK